MLNLTIQDLAALTGGRLALSEMPPLGGVGEPIRRIVFESRKVRPGYVYWALPKHDMPQQTAAAFKRSALGVVSESNNLTPWAGAFSLAVLNAEAALIAAAAYLRPKFAGTLVIVLGDDSPADLFEALFAVLDGRTKGVSHALKNLTDAACKLVDLPASARSVVLQCSLQDFFQVEAVLKLCQADVAVISSAALLSHGDNSASRGNRLTCPEVATPAKVPSDWETLQAVVFAAAEQAGRPVAQTAARWQAWRQGELTDADGEETCRGGRQCAVRRQAA